MNVLPIFNPKLSPSAVLLAILIAATSGCQDLASQEDAPALSKLNSEVPAASEPARLPAASEPAAKPVANAPAEGPIANAPAEVAAPSEPAESTTADQPAESPAPRDQPQPRAVPQAAATEQETSKPVPPNQVGRKPPTAVPAVRPSEVYEPRVALSQAHAQTCLVNVGETLPNLALTGLSGEPVVLDDLRGERLTVVVFWTTRLAFGREQFARLVDEVALPYRHLGVKVVAVNVGDPVEQIELDAVAQDTMTCVHDADGSAIAKVATSMLPRTYLIDAEGRILWFDVEYSRTTRRQLKNAIFYHSRDLDPSS